jgi:signal transduction histidine kinase
MQSRSVDVPVKPAKTKHLPWKGKVARTEGTENLLHLKPRTSAVATERTRYWKRSVLFTLSGVFLGILFGYFQYHYHLLGPTSPWSSSLLEFGVPAVLGGGAAALVAWLHAQRRLTQALITSEGFRRRLMSVERNQALWISLSAVLHDVRNPLHNVTLLVEMLGTPNSDTAAIQKQVLQELERINIRIRRVMGQVSEFSGEIRRRPVCLTDVLDEVADMIAPLARRSAVSFSVDGPRDAQVVADPKFLVQAIDHLILNSLQILVEHEGGQHRLSVWATMDEKSVWLLIEDSGPGLPESVQERLFEPLTTSSSQGMGLGLAIAHALSTAAGGELMLARTGETGTQFRLRLDRA